MSIGGLHVGRASARKIETRLRRARADDVSYDHVGSTLLSSNGAAIAMQRDRVGHGAADFSVARAALRTWVPQRAGLGACVEPAGQRVALGATVIIVLRLGPFYVLAPDRVVAVIDEPRRYGFAYGTLPGHAERGEESFVVELLDNDDVRLSIGVDAEPGTWAAKAAAPVVRWLQRVAVGRYLGAVAHHVATADALATDEPV